MAAESLSAPLSDEFFSAPQTLRCTTQTVNIKLFFHATTWARHDKNWDVWHLALCSFLNRLFVMHLRLYSSCPSPQYRFPVRFDSPTHHRPNNDQDLQTNRRHQHGRFSFDQPKNKPDWGPESWEAKHFASLNLPAMANAVL